MLIQEYVKSCIQFSHDTYKWAELDDTKFYTTTPNGGWEETCDNAHGGLDVSWAFKLTSGKIKEFGPQEFVNRCCEEITALIDNEVDYDTLRDAVIGMMGRF